MLTEIIKQKNELKVEAANVHKKFLSYVNAGDNFAAGFHYNKLLRLNDRYHEMCELEVLYTLPTEVQPDQPTT